MAPSRIIYVLKIFPKLSETFIVHELAELRRRGVQLKILSLLPPREELRQRLVSESGLDSLACYDPAQFSAEVQAFRPQLLHAHFATESTETARALASQYHLPFTFTSHGYDIYRKPPQDFAERAAAAAALVTVSQANAEHITKRFGVPETHIHVIPCGIDLGRFRPLPEWRNGDLPMVLCVARHVVVKNLTMLLRSCAILHERGLAFRCVLIGDGPCRSELEDLRTRLNLTDMVRFAGAAEQSVVLEHWQHAAAGVLTSNSEGMPVSLMEAAACGVPVVATNVGGVPELVENGRTGLLTQAGDVAAFGSALERLLVSPELRAAMGAAARARAERFFSVETQVNRLLALWSEVLCRKDT